MPKVSNLQLRIVGQSHTAQVIGTPGLAWKRRLDPIIAAVTVLYGALWSSPLTIGSLSTITVVVVIVCFLTVTLSRVDIVIRMRQIDRLSPSPPPIPDSAGSPEQGASPVMRRLWVYFGILAVGIAWLIVIDNMAIVGAIGAILAIGVIRLPTLHPPLTASILAACISTVTVLLFVAIGFLANGGPTPGIVILVGLPLGLLASGTAAAYAVIETQRRRSHGVLVVPPSRGEIIAGRLSAILLGGAYLSCLILVGVGVLPFWLLLPVISFPVALKSLADITGMNSDSAKPLGGLHIRLTGSLLVFSGLSATGILLARLLPL